MRNEEAGFMWEYEALECLCAHQIAESWGNQIAESSPPGSLGTAGAHGKRSLAKYCILRLTFISVHIDNSTQGLCCVMDKERKESVTYSVSYLSNLLYFLRCILT